MALDRIIALFFLLLSVVYGYAAYHYPLLPFERNMPFLPNTLPIALGVFGALVSLFILVSPRSPELTGDGDDAEDYRSFEYGKALGLVVAMVLYALLLRPIGFLPATALFIAGSAVVLGERKFLVLVPIALIASGSVWYLVQETLGIFLSPWPAFLE